MKAWDGDHSITVKMGGEKDVRLVVEEMSGSYGKGRRVCRYDMRC